MRILLLIFITLFSANTSASFARLKDDLAIFKLARENFFYQADEANEVRIYTDIESRFAGDCEDFAYSLAMRIGGEVWFTFNADKQPHAVVLTPYGFVFDSELEWPLRRDTYPNRLLFKIGFNHFEKVFVNGQLARAKAIIR